MDLTSAARRQLALNSAGAAFNEPISGLFRTVAETVLPCGAAFSIHLIFMGLVRRRFGKRLELLRAARTIRTVGSSWRKQKCRAQQCFSFFTSIPPHVCSRQQCHQPQHVHTNRKRPSNQHIHPRIRRQTRPHQHGYRRTRPPVESRKQKPRQPSKSTVGVAFQQIRNHTHSISRH